MMPRKYETHADALTAKQQRDRIHQIAYRHRRAPKRLVHITTPYPGGTVETRRLKLVDGRIIWTHFVLSDSGGVRPAKVTIGDKRTVITDTVRAQHDKVVTDMGGNP